MATRYNAHFIKVFCLLGFLPYRTCLFAQSETSADLHKTLREKDSLLFDIGFNTCDISQFEALISNDFEFYHDQAGITSSKADFISGIRNNICNLPYKPKRVLDKPSLKAQPLKRNGILYGAVQTGKHSFYTIEKGKPEYLTSTAEFTHVWLIENGQWQLSRSISYDHRDIEKPIDTALLFRDKNETERWLRQKQVPALGIGYIKDGKILQTSVFGELEKGRPAPANTLWNIASLTKPVTALVALKLVEAGKWSLDEPLYPYFVDPDIKDDPRARMLNIRIILSHRAGFPNWRRLNKDGKLAFAFDPGTEYQYSGEGYEYLRKALENKFGKTLDQLADELIFKPLGMQDTRFYWDNSVDEQRFAKWHTKDGALYETYKNSNANAADNLLTTVEDYCKLMLHVMSGAGLSEPLHKEMIAEQARISDRQYFGLGWYVDKNINSKKDFAIAHGGDDIGVHTIVFMLPHSKQGLLIFTNSDNGTDAFIDVILKYLGEDGQGIIDVETKK